MALPPFLASAVQTWADYYEGHRMVSVTVRFLHLGALLVGGGAALVADRQVLARTLARRGNAFEALDGSHRIVVPALAVVVLSGLLMVASDLSTFVNSRLFWTKMGLVTLLLLNGAALVSLESAAKRGRASAINGVSVVSGVSLVLWLTILFFGVWLTAAA